MRVLITGIDGYEGWPLACWLAWHEHTVIGVDAYFRRNAWTKEFGVESITPIASVRERELAFGELQGLRDPRQFYSIDLSRDYCHLKSLLSDFQPEVIFHLAEQPSAPYSMVSQAHANDTVRSNVLGTLNLLWAIRETVPDAHLVYVSTMGEYGTPPWTIPEGFFEALIREDGDIRIGAFEGRGAVHLFPAPRIPGSFYHASKVASGTLVSMCARIWGLRVSAFMQGVVFGTAHFPDNFMRPVLQTRLDIDEKFGTVFHRFIAQATLRLPITLYGAGEQRRGLISLMDCIEDFRRVMDVCPDAGEYQVYNQITGIYSVSELANAVRDIGIGGGYVDSVHVDHIENPRVEQEQHVYSVATSRIAELRADSNAYISPRTEAVSLFQIMQDNLPRLESLKGKIFPETTWGKK